MRQAFLEWSNKKREISQSIALTGMVSLLLKFQNQLGRLEKHMEEISATIPDVELLKTIPGIGDKLAA